MYPQVCFHIMASEPVEVLFAGERSRVLLCRGADDEPSLLKISRLSHTNRAAAERARREVNLCLQSLGGFVVSSQGWLRVGDELCVRLDYMPGGDLDLLLDRQGSLAPHAARFYCGCAALGLQALHERAILHRDVKPDNIAIGGDGYAKLVDLGFGIGLESPGGRATTMLGTPEFLSPEAFQGMGQTASSDMYALGVTLYVLLLSSHPYAACDNPQDLYRLVLSEPPFFPCNIISDAARALISACMQRDEASRPRAEELWRLAFFAGPPAPLSLEKAPLLREAVSNRSHPPPFLPRLHDGPFDTFYFEEAAGSSDDDSSDDGHHVSKDAEDINTRMAVLAVQHPGGETTAAVASGSRRERAAARKKAHRNRELHLASGAAVLSQYHTAPCESVEELLAGQP